MQKCLRIWLLALVLNAPWEFAHARLYTVHGLPVPWTRLALSIFGDAWIVLGMYLLFCLIWRNVDWYRSQTKLRLCLFALLGGMIAVIVEIHAVYYAGLWEYTSAMPTVGGIGLTPLLQMIVLPVLTVGLAEFACRK